MTCLASRARRAPSPDAIDSPQHRDGKFRKIEIKVRDKDDIVQARKGYYATKNDAA